MADAQAALFGHSKKVLTQTKMAVQTVAGARDIREQAGFAATALPLFIYRIYRAFFTQVLFALVPLISRYCRAFGAHFLAALGVSRQQAAARIISRYRHLIDCNGYCD